ncbi:MULTISPECIES: hypothetical protein [Streptomyces]|uniref:hypothetical protein n=1 Tax=Streptomyces TaxID=1883 RepID=UPI00339E0C1D
MSAPQDDALAQAVAEHGPFPMPVGTKPVPMTPDREQEIRAREQAATPGPWQSDGAEIYGTLGGVLMIDLWVGETLDIENQARSDADAAFMADARSAVPELLAEVARLRARVAELEAQPSRAVTLREASESVASMAYSRYSEGAKTTLLEASQMLADNAAEAEGPTPVEDPHDGPLHHSYALGRDLPEEPEPSRGPCGYDDYHDGHPWADRPHVWCPGHSYADDDEAVSS